MVDVKLMHDLAQAHELYYLHPSIGYFGEGFRFEPHGFFFQLKPCSPQSLEPAPLSPGLIATNQAFWQAAVQTEFSNLLQATNAKPRHERLKMWVATPERNRWEELRNNYFSCGVNSWGVELQKNGLYQEASVCFEQAVRLNEGNIDAQLNLQFNRDRQARKPLAILSPRQIDAKFSGQKGGYPISRDGPIDEPNFCRRLGGILSEVHLYRQAAEQFTRAKELAPEEMSASVGLAQILLTFTNYPEALAETDRVLDQTPHDPKGLFVRARALVGLKSYDQALLPLNELVEIVTNSPLPRLERAEVHSRLNHVGAAMEDYQTAGQSGVVMAYYKMAEVADHATNTEAAIAAYNLFLEKAPASAPNQAEARLRLRQLQFKAPSR